MHKQANPSTKSMLVAVAALAVAAALAPTQAATAVSGIVAGETWNTNGSPYLVTGDILVAQLTIQASVEIQFLTNAVFEVAGILQAQGTEAQPIRFWTPNTAIGWKGIFFNQNGSESALRYCRVQGSTNSGIRIINSTPSLTYCVIANNTSPLSGGGVYADITTGGTLILDHCTITNNTVLMSTAEGGGGARVRINGSAQFLGCVISGNAWRGSSGTGGGGLLCQGGGSYTLKNCTIAQNHGGVSGGGVTVIGAFLGLANCLVMSNTVVAGSGNGSGVFVHAGNTSARINNCTIVGNAYEGAAVAGNGPPGGYLFVTNSILYFNNSGGSQTSGNNLTLAYSDVQNGGTTNGNITTNPVLMPGTLELLTGSPCIDSGNPAPAFNDTCFPPSKGGARNDMGAYGGPGACDWLIGEAPQIVAGPQSQSSCLGQSVTFSVSAVGAQPLGYQWQFNGAPIAGQTSNSLTLANLQNANAGSYAVFVTNVFGSVTSAPAQLVIYDACVDLQMYAGLNISGQRGSTYVLKFTTDLSNTNFATWTPLATNMMGSSSWFYLDMDSPFSPKRFYGVKLAP